VKTLNTGANIKEGLQVLKRGCKY